MSKNVVIYVSTGFAGIKHEERQTFEDFCREWDLDPETATEEEIDAAIDQASQDMLDNNIDRGGYVEDEE